MDHSTNLISAISRVSLRAGETLVEKKTFETFSHDCGINIKHIHGNYGIFTSREFN